MFLVNTFQKHKESALCLINKSDIIILDAKYLIMRGILMQYFFQKLTQSNALLIANEWKYPGKYSFYDFSADKEDYEEFIDSEKRGDSYYQVLLEDDLVGFLCYTLDGLTTDIGIGMRPDLTGKGLGNEYLKACIDHIIQKHKRINTITLSVAQFNERAIKVYEKLGFKETVSFNQETNGDTYSFISMKKDI